MPRYGMVIDLDLCTGCGACVTACAQENNVALGDPSAPHRLIRWLEMLATEDEQGTSAELVPMPCMMCDKPPCTTVCPVNATFLGADGLVPQIYPQCIGCRYCVNACPYTCKYYNYDDPVWPGQMRRGLNPDVSIRSRGVTEKCNFCMHRIQRAHEDAVADGEALQADSIQTACQQVCPTEAITFGDLDDSGGAFAVLAKSPRGTRLLEDLGTEPKVIYLRPRR